MPDVRPPSRVSAGMRKTLLLALLAVYTFHIKVTDARTALLANPHLDELKLSPEQLERAAHDRVMMLDHSSGAHWIWLMMSEMQATRENTPETHATAFATWAPMAAPSEGCFRLAGLLTAAGPRLFGRMQGDAPFPMSGMSGISFGLGEFTAQFEQALRRFG